MEKNKNISLNQIGNKLPFTVPENYFEQFALQFDAQIAVKPISKIGLLKPWMYIAAMFLGVLFFSRISYTAFQNNKSQNAENYELYVMSQVNEAEIMDFYLAEENIK